MADRASSIVTDDDDDDELFRYEENIQEAERPEVLPERTYVGTIVDVRRTSTNTGKSNLTLSIMIPPENYPADFKEENAPDGVTVRFKSQDLSPDTPRGKYNAKRLAEAMGLSSTVNLKKSDFMDKRVKIEVTHFEVDDGPILVTRGLPTLKT
jgi:hypothetical protein